MVVFAVSMPSDSNITVNRVGENSVSLTVNIEDIGDDFEKFAFVLVLYNNENPNLNEYEITGKSVSFIKIVTEGL